MSLTEPQLIDAALGLAAIAGTVANVCDHAEHSELVDMHHVRRSGERLRELALSTAIAAGQDPLDLYAARLGAIERRNVLHHRGAYDGETAARRGRTWRDLQLVQIEHDRFYHPDVLGLAKLDQLRHYALHLTKLAGAAAEAVADAADHEDFVGRRVPDMLLFGIKLSTVAGVRLDDEPTSPFSLSAPGSSVAERVG
jgi:hypothetical protein